MPYQLKRPCGQPGCPNLTNRGYCNNHRRTRRGSAAARGYGGRWRKYRLMFLRSRPLCVECEKEGQVTAATDIDHIRPVRGKNDPLFWEPSNLQPLCKSHHSQKTMRENAISAG